MRYRALAVVATTFFGVACSTIFAQDVFELSGDVDSNSTATEFNVIPAPNGDIEFFALPPDGSALLSVETIGQNLFLARLDFSLENGDPAWAEFMLFGDTGDHFIVATSTNFSSSSAFSDKFVLGGPGWIPQDSIYVVDSGGTVHKPTDHDGFIDVIEGIKANGNTITTLIIKGHGCGDPPLIGLGPDAILTCPGGTIMVTPTAGGSSTDITDTMNDVCDGNTVIRFRGCFTKPLADDVEDALDGEPDVKGAIRFVIGIPWTRWGIGVYR